MPPLVPLLAFFILIGPVVAGLAGMILPAFGYFPALGGTSLSLDPLAALFAQPGLARSALLSLTIGIAATFMAFAVVMLFVASWQGTRMFRALERLIAPLLSVPHAAAAFGLVLLLAPSGFLVRLASPWITGWERPPDLLVIHDPGGVAMILGLAVKEIPFLFLMVLAALPQAKATERAEMMASLGYGRIRGFAHATFPALYGQIRLPVLAVLAFSTSVVDVALILGPTLPPPLAIRVLDWQYDSDLGMRFVAAAGALLQCLVTAAALAIWLAGERITSATWRRRLPTGRRGRGEASIRLFAAGLMAFAAAIVIGGIALLVLWSVSGPWRFPAALPSNLDVARWASLAPGLAELAFRSTLLASLCGAAAVVLAIAFLESEFRNNRGAPMRGFGALYVPLLVPQIAFLFGLQILFALLRLDGTFLAVAAAHLVFVFPYVLLSLSEPWRHWDFRHALVIRALGRGPGFVLWRVRLPMMLRPVLTAWAIGFAVSIGLYLPTVLVGGGRIATITTETVALFGGGDPRLIGATALVQALLPFLGFAVAMAVPVVAFRNRRLLRAGR